MSSLQTALHHFHPLVRDWFTQKYGQPTDIQTKTWAEIAQGRHVLITAPTGCGKTLAAFLWALNELIVGTWPRGQVRVLYISPLKALNNDIRLNLLEPLSELDSLFTKNQVPFPALSVQTRSGDTPQQDRQRMIRRPPEILITTPESLNLILSSKRSRLLLSGLAAVILDEIHAIAGNKRGTHLITAVDRLIPLSGEFQRIGLSATIRPLQKVAHFLGGYQMLEQSQDAGYTKRPVRIVHSAMSKEYEVRVHFPGSTAEERTSEFWWQSLTKKLLEIIQHNESTLIFTNSRRHTEKITRFINDAAGDQVAYSHHGSLAREIRQLVEQKLKQGELKAIVATSSLELGIDVGVLDRIILIQAPFSISSGIQRIGRAGHTVGETSKAIIFPLHGRDFLNCALVARAVMDRDLEEIRIPICPLDILAQVIVSMVVVEEWDRDELFYFIKTSYPFHELPRKQYELVLDMLTGRYADSRIRELQQRISIDGLDNTVAAKSGAAQLLYLSGGSIPDRGYFNLRIQDSKAKIGELDEEFVWERSVGDTFTFGTQSWRIQKIDFQTVEVVPRTHSGVMIPFWKAEPVNWDFHLSQKIGLFLEEWNDRLDDPQTIAEMEREYFMEQAAATELIDFLKRQKEVTGTDLPMRHHLVIEHFHDPLNRSDTKQVILHTLWGGKINAPYAIALSAVWEDKFGYPLQIFHDNDCIMLNLPHEIHAEDLLELVRVDNFESLLRKKLESTGFFGARFRENAARALLLPRKTYSHRMPLWLNRLRSKKLFAAITRYPDFPILVETWRTCLQDEFDVVNLKLLLDELQQGVIKISEIYTKQPSPFTSGLIWQHTNKFMYEDDTPLQKTASLLREDLIRDLVFTSELRPQLAQSLVQEFEQKIQRTYEGYSPATNRDLVDWIKERVVIPEPEWDALLQAMDRDHQLDREGLLQAVESKFSSIDWTGAIHSSIIATEKKSRLVSTINYFQGQNTHDTEKLSYLTSIIEEWLRFYGPVEKEYLAQVFGFSDDIVTILLETLLDKQVIIVDFLTEDADKIQLCDAQNFEMLLRMKARKARPVFEALDVQYLPLFCATIAGLTEPSTSLEGLQTCLEKLMGYPAPAALWESDILPARLVPYYPNWLDTLMQESDLSWFGTDKEKISFCFRFEDELFRVPKQVDSALERIFPDGKGKYSFWDLLDKSNLPSGALADELWRLTWLGLITNDSIVALRTAIQNRFQIGKLPHRTTRRRRTRTGFNRWKNTRPFSGNWYILEPVEKTADLLEQEELIRDRIRQLCARYGILFKELLSRELPQLRWSALLKSLRLMELSGEILTGHFFKDIPGLQFIAHSAYRRLQQGLDEKAIYWLNATDPASLCGVQLPALKQYLPKRLATTHLVFQGKECVLVSQRNGQNLEFKVSPEHQHFKEYLSFLKILISREVQPLKAVRTYQVNGQPVVESDYLEALLTFGFSKDYDCLVLRAPV